jgi:glutaminyl-tRNA synthetase
VLQVLQTMEKDNALTDMSASDGHNFIRDIVSADIENGKAQKIITRFPPEPNGYLHIGHAKSICLNFGIATEFGGTCNLRFDDTNPAREAQEYVEAIMTDVRWLGFDWGDNLYFASNYFEQLSEWAIHLVQMGKAYVDDLSADEIREYRGTLTTPGTSSPYRDRSIEKNSELFEKMKAGRCKEGEHVLRAKIDMTSGNINLRDPVLYRVIQSSHPRTGNSWHIYPTYDFAHGQSDSLENISHSVCTLEFEDHRPLYEWFLNNLPVPSKPRQYEFGRLALSHTVLSKRVLTRLVNENVVCGWNDPRMPTLAGLRRRGFPPEAIRDFAGRIGVSKRDSVVDVAMLEHCVRHALNQKAPRYLAVLRPLKVIIDNYPVGKVEKLPALNNPNDTESGHRLLPFSREIFIEEEDFLEDPPRKFFRLAPGKEVRLRYAYLITCTAIVKDPSGKIIEIHCTYDPETKGGTTPDGRKVKGTLHWVAAEYAHTATIRLFENLFRDEKPDLSGELQDAINPNSEEILQGCMLEPSLAEAEMGIAVQFERLGYFCRDITATKNSDAWNRTIGLRDSWAKKSMPKN